MTTQIADLVGLTEIAERCKVNKNVASGWTRKHDFPRPKHKLAMGPMWDWNEVEDWLFPGGKPQLEIKLLSGAMFAYVPKRWCMHCESTNISVLPGAELRIDGDNTLVEFTYRCNDCKAEVDRSESLTKEEA